MPDVPHVIGTSQSDAEAALSAAGLTVGTVTPEESSTDPTGHVIRTRPAAGASVASGSPVDLDVSSGPPQVTVPDVTGSTRSDAEAALTAAGLTVRTVTPEESSTEPAGNVIRTTPAAGESVASGSAVELAVSSGPPRVTVPNLIGKSQSDAEAAIDQR